MFKAFSRTQVDFRIPEQITSLFQLLTPSKSCASDRVPEFEQRFAEYVGVKHAIAFPYCRTAMYFVLKALEFKPGSEIILPAFTFWVDAGMVELAGYKPVFVDVDFETMSLDPAKVEAAITDKTKAIFPTNLNGLAADLDPILEIAKKHNLRVIEDSARSCGVMYKGRRVGSSDIGTFSFGYGKSIYDIHGGMATTNDDELAAKLREYKKEFKPISTKDLYIQTIKGIILTWLNKPLLYPLFLFQYIWKFQVEGKEKYANRFRPKVLPYATVPESFTVDMNNLQVKLGLSQLKRLDETNATRRKYLQLLNSQLQGVGDLVLPPDSDERPHVGVHYTLWTKHKAELQKYLTEHRIDSQDESAVDTTKLERFKHVGEGSFPASEKLDKHVLFIPTHVSLSRENILYFADTVKAFYEKK